jgi:hypothetical protein
LSELAQHQALSDNGGCAKPPFEGLERCGDPPAGRRAILPAGLDYFSHGHVESVEDRGGSINAVVRGSQDYTVRLAADDGVLDYACDCPVGSDGDFCKPMKS